MLLLLMAVPAIVLVTVAHGLLRTYAPSNVLIRRVRASRANMRMGAGLVVLAWACALGVHMLNTAIDGGAPGWLHVIVLVLAWDAIKIGLLALHTASRRLFVLHLRPGTNAGHSI
jgi:hypothetical protein